MNRFVTLKHASFVAISLLGVVVTSPASAEETLTGPSLETEGKPTSPPAPVDGIKPRLAGFSAFGGVMVADMGPVNDRLSAPAYPNEVPAVFPFLGGQGFGLFSHFLIGGSGGQGCLRGARSSRATVQYQPAAPGARSISAINWCV